MPEIKTERMYYLAPLLKQPESLLLPQCMYQLPVTALNVAIEKQSSQSASGTYKVDGTGEASRSAGDVAKLELSARQEAVLARLQGLQLQLDQLKSKQPQAGVQQNSTASSLPSGSQFQQSGVCHDLVIRASPQCPPYSVLVLAAALRDAGCTVLTSSLLHSSLQHSEMPAGLQESFKSSSVSGGGRADHQIVVSVVWSDVTVPSLMVSPLHQCPIVGEANILRYLCRLLPATSPYHYEADASFAAIAATDQLLDSCSAVLASASDKRATAKFIGSIETRLKCWRESTSQFGRCGDAGLWSALKQLAARGAQLTPSVARWLAAHDSIFLAGVAQ